MYRARLWVSFVEYIDPFCGKYRALLAESGKARDFSTRACLGQSPALVVSLSCVGKIGFFCRKYRALLAESGLARDFSTRACLALVSLCCVGKVGFFCGICRTLLRNM